MASPNENAAAAKPDADGPKAAAKDTVEAAQKAPGTAAAATSKEKGAEEPAAKKTVGARKSAAKPSPRTAKTKTPKRAATTRSASKQTKPNTERNGKMATKQNPTEAMKAQAETAMSQSKAAFEDMTAKSKEAMEKNAKVMEELGGLTRGNVEAMVEAGRIYAEGTQAMARDTADFARKQAEETAQTMQAMSGVKNPNEVVELQGKYVRGQFDAVVAQTSAMTERALKLSGDVMAPFQNRMATAMEKFTKVA